MHAYNHGTWEENPEFETRLGYIVSSSPVWVTQPDSVPQTNKQTHKNQNQKVNINKPPLRIVWWQLQTTKLKQFKALSSSPIIASKGILAADLMTR